MNTSTNISIPALLKVGQGTLGNIGQYLKQAEFNNVALFFGNGLIKLFGQVVSDSLARENITVLVEKELDSVKIEDLTDLAFGLDPKIQVIVAIGGGKVIDAGKYAAFLRKLPYISVPTSASSDGFSSASASLLVQGRRKSVPASMAYGIIADIEVLKSAPAAFIYSGIGDMVSKITAIYDWEYEAARGFTSKNDFSIMVAKKAVNSFVRTPFETIRDDLFLKELVDSLTLSGIANEIAGGSSPTSGSEHLISHALDSFLDRPQLHGIQVGIATYLMSRVQNHRYQRINTILRKTGFWNYVSTLNLKIEDFDKAIDLAPSVKPHRHTYLHEEQYRLAAKQLLREDPVLARIFKGEKPLDYEALIFDMDGTLWDATENIIKSWNIALKHFPELKDRQFTKAEFEAVMGLPMDAIAARLFPEFTPTKQMEILDACCLEENKYLTTNGGVLFPKVKETIEILAKKYKLLVVTNGQSGYVQSLFAAHNIGQYFCDFQNWGDNKVPKGDNIKLVMQRNGLQTAAYIGDTKGDMEAAQRAGIDFIFARYGFGNAPRFDYAIDSFAELLELL